MHHFEVPSARSDQPRSGRREMESAHHHGGLSSTLHATLCFLMSLSRLGRLSPSLISLVGRAPATATLRPAHCRFWVHFQRRNQHNRPPGAQQNRRQTVEPKVHFPQKVQVVAADETVPHATRLEDVPWPNVKVRYLRPAIWALLVSGGIFTGLAYLQARQETKPKSSQRWVEAPQWSTQQRGPPSPTKMASQLWAQLDPISRVSCGLIAANSAVHLSSYLVPNFWSSLWHMPARNVNYTQFSSMFVHSGPFHLFVNMYATYNFMIPVGYSRAFDGNPYHVLSFFLATGVLSGFGQHWSTLITPQRRAVPEIFIRCGGASGALLGILGVFCMQYPNAGLGIILLPFHFEAQYVLPAIMLFDFVGMVRGYSFVNFGHAVCCSSFTDVYMYSLQAGASFWDRNWSGLLVF
jgi:rhomboid-like protein